MQNVRDVEYKDGMIKGIMSVDVPFQFKAKKKGSWMLNFGGHAELMHNDSEEAFASAWGQGWGDYKIYFDRGKYKNDDDLELHIQPSEVFDEKYIIGLLEFVKSRPELQQMFDDFNKSQTILSNKVEEEIKRRNEKREEEELADLERQIEEEEKLLKKLKDVT